jgi:hypothetical protein
VTDQSRRDAGADSWQSIVDRCAGHLEDVQHGLNDADWDALASLAWTEPVPLGAPSDEVKERLQRLLKLSRSLQRRVATEIRSVRDELARGPEVRRASRAYLQAGGGRPATTPGADATHGGTLPIRPPIVP